MRDTGRKLRRLPQLDHFPTASAAQTNLSMVWPICEQVLGRAAPPKARVRIYAVKNVQGLCRQYRVQILQKYLMVTCNIFPCVCIRHGSMLSTLRLTTQIDFDLKRGGPGVWRSDCAIRRSAQRPIGALPPLSAAGAGPMHLLTRAKGSHTENALRSSLESKPDLVQWPLRST